MSCRVTTFPINGRSKDSNPDKKALSSCMYDTSVVLDRFGFRLDHSGPHPEQHHGLAGHLRQERPVMAPFEIVDPRGTILIDRFDFTFRSLAVRHPVTDPAFVLQPDTGRDRGGS